MKLDLKFGVFFLLDVFGMVGWREVFREQGDIAVFFFQRQKLFRLQSKVLQSMFFKSGFSGVSGLFCFVFYFQGLDKEGWLRCKRLEQGCRQSFWKMIVYVVCWRRKEELGVQGVKFREYKSFYCRKKYFFFCEGNEIRGNCEIQRFD